jgi:hypothetical protein
VNATTPARRRTRVGVAAASLLVSASLVAGCATEARTPPPDDVPTTLAAKPTVKPQPKVTIKAEAPDTVLYGISSATADQIWQQSLDLISDWMLNPKYMQRHKPKSIDELDGLTKLMTEQGAATWRTQTHRALEGYLKPTPEWWEKKVDLDKWVHQLVVYNLTIRRDRGWDNPMLTPVKVSDGLVVTGKGGVGVIMTINTKFRLIGQGKNYRVPTKSVLGLAWVPDGDGWKLAQWWRVYGMGAEHLKGWKPGDPAPDYNGGSETDAINNATAEPDDGASSSGGPTPGKTLYPE